MSVSGELVEQALRTHYRARLEEEAQVDRCAQELEALALLMSGEAAGEEVAALRAQVAGSARCLAVVEALGADAARAAGVAQVLRARARAEVRRERQTRPGLLVLAAAALIALMIMPVALRDQGPTGELDGSTLVPKSGELEADALLVAAAREGRRWRIRAGERLAAGDSVGLFSASARPGWLMVVHVDAAGDTTLLYPAGGEESARLELGNEVALPDGARMTQGAGCEWFVAVFSDEALSVAEVERALGEPGRGGEGCQRTFLVPGARTVRALGVTR